MVVVVHLDGGVRGDDLARRAAGCPPALPHRRSDGRLRGPGDAVESKDRVRDEVLPQGRGNRGIDEIPRGHLRGTDTEPLREPTEHGSDAPSSRVLEADLYKRLQPRNHVVGRAGVRGARLKDWVSGSSLVGVREYVIVREDDP